MTARKLAVAVASLGTLLVAFPAAAQSPVATGVVVEEDPHSRSRFGGRAILDTAVGTGTFVSDQFSDDPLVLTTLSLRPAYRLDDIPGIGAFMVRQDLALELTQPDAPNGRRYDFADTQLLLLAPSLYTEPTTQILTGADFRVVLPISFVSRTQRKWTGATLGAHATRTFGPLLADIRLQGTKNFYSYTNVVLDAQDVANVNGGGAFAHCRIGEDFCAGGAFLVNWSMVANGTVSYAVTDKISTTLLLTYAAGWRFSSPDDEFTSKAVDVDGNRVVQTGAARMADQIGATFDVSYAFNDMFAFSAGANTLQPTLTADNKSFRLPLFDFSTPSNNFSTLYFDVVATF